MFPFISSLKMLISRFSVIFVILILVIFGPGNFIASANQGSPAANAEQNQPMDAFPPTGYFVTHIFPRANRISVASNGEVFAYGSTSIHKSTDFGSLWKALDTTVTPGGDFWVLEPSPDYISDRTVFLGINTGYNSLWISQDGGATWALPVNSINGSRSLAFSPNYVNDNVIYVGTSSYPWLYRSSDRGQHWEWVGYPGAEAIIKVVISPDYVNDHTIFFLTSGGLWSMVEGKNSALVSMSGRAQTDLQIYDFIVSPNYGADAIIYLATNVGVFVTSDGGINWTLISNQVFYSLSIAPDYASSGILVGGSTTGGMRSVNAGYAWEQVIIPRVFNYRFSPNYASDATIYACTEDGLFVSTDHGATWQTKSPNLPYNEFGLETIELSPGFSTDSTLFVGPAMGETGYLYKSADGGYSIVQLPTPESGKPIFTLSGTYPTDHTVFVAFDNRLYVSIDGGWQWLPLPALPAVAWVLRTSPQFSSDHTIFIATREAGVFRSTNGGVSWEDITGILSTYVDALEISSGFPAQPTLFAYSNGFARSDDGGDTWYYPAKQAMVPNVLLQLSASFPTDHTLFYASGEWIYRSMDGAQTWQDIHYWNYFWGQITALTVSPRFITDQTVIAGSRDRPLYLSQDAGDYWFALQGLPELGRRAAAIGYDQAGRMIPIALSREGVYWYVWPEFTPLSPQVVQTSAGPGDPQFVTRKVAMQVSGESTPGIVLGESADWLEITPISGTLPLDFNFTFDTSSLVDRLETTITADVYWSMNDVQHYAIPVTLTRATNRTLLPLIRH